MRHGGRRARPLAERFWSRVEKRSPESCWLWAGKRNVGGYGRIVNEKRERMAHRVAWELTHGPIPGGFQVLHHCDNPPCVNPGHLFLGTIKDNAKDKIAKGRQATPAPGRGVARGPDHMFARLTWDQVRAIRILRSRENAAIEELAETYGVSPMTIAQVIYNITYREP